MPLEYRSPETQLKLANFVWEMQQLEDVDEFRMFANICDSYPQNGSHKEIKWRMQIETQNKLGILSRAKACLTKNLCYKKNFNFS